MRQKTLQMLASTKLDIALRAQGRVRSDCNFARLAQGNQRFLSKVRVHLNLVHSGFIAGVTQDVDEQAALDVASLSVSAIILGG